MAEWSVKLQDETAKELEDCFLMGPIITDDDLRYITEELVTRLGKLKIEVFSNEHPPPHFRVYYQGESNNFRISDCEPLNGDGLSLFFRNIKKWHKKNKDKLIEIWNKKRPTDCPVGAYVESASSGGVE